MKLKLIFLQIKSFLFNCLYYSTNHSNNKMIKRANTEPNSNILISSLSGSEKDSSRTKQYLLSAKFKVNNLNNKNFSRKGSSQSESAGFEISNKNALKKYSQCFDDKEIPSPMTPNYKNVRYIYEADKTYTRIYDNKQKSIKSLLRLKLCKNSLIPCQNQNSSQSTRKNKTQTSDADYTSARDTMITQKQQLPKQVIDKLSQFIQYRLQKQKQIQKSKQQYLAQMQEYPLQIKQQQLKQLRVTKEKQQQNYNMIVNDCKQKKQQIQAQIKLIQQQKLKYNILVISLVTNHVKFKQLQKQINRLQQQITQTEEYVNRQFELIQSSKKLLFVEFDNKNAQIKEKIKRYHQEIQETINLQKNIDSKKLRKTQIMKQKLELQKKEKDLIKNSSLHDLKIQLQSLKQQQKQSVIKLSNKQLKQIFYSNLNRKLQIIKTNIGTQSQNLKFLNSLKLTQKESQGILKITPQSNDLTQKQIQMIEINNVQFKRYKQYLKQDVEILKLQQILNEDKINFENKISKIKKDIEEIKTLNNECTNQIKNLDNMQKIRSAEIQELKKIVQGKRKQIQDYQAKNQHKKMDNFRNVLVGVGTLGGLNLPINFSKGKNKQ